MIATERLEYHKLASMFPRPCQEQKHSLWKSIKENGLLEPIALFEDKILDGISRYEVCMELGVEPKFTEDLNGFSPVEYVNSRNFARRHLSASQLAAVALEIIEARRDFRRKYGGKITETVVETSHKFSISHSQIDRAGYVKKHNGKLFEGIKDGKISVTAAYCQVKPDFKKKLEVYRATAVDVTARKILENVDTEEFNGIPNVFASDFEIWAFDKHMRRQGYNLSLVRVGDNFDAKYIKEETKTNGFCGTYKAAIISAAREVLK